MTCESGKGGVSERKRPPVSIRGGHAMADKAMKACRARSKPSSTGTTAMPGYRAPMIAFLHRTST